ncbi:MAG TPA: response regulator transcription factor [Gaiellaceae bacterium]|nr:response regulator transcription factor [Gaiellaceae bacterium]
MAELRDTPGKRRIEVLLVDDDELFVESLRALVDDQPSLSVAGTAVNGLEAIELVEELAPAAVVIDVHMPLLDGVTTVARMRRDHPALCLIVMTADGKEELHQAVSEAGADAVLMKDDLAARLHHEITSAHADRLAAAV